MTDIEELKRNLRTKRETVEVIDTKDLLSSGSTLLNLACSGRPNGAFLKGRYYFVVGDSASGKTFLTLTCLAEAALSKHFRDYRFIFDNSEDGALMDVEHFFGSVVAERMEPPNEDQDGPIYSESIEQFYDHLDDACKDDRPFIYILDSMDSLGSEAEDEKFEEQKTARRKGRESAGSYGDGKAKKNSAGLRRILPHLRRTGSILIIISQTRDNLGFGFEKKTRSGGRALRFYATLELWSSIKKKIKRKIKGDPLQLGIICEIQIKKNRLTGKERKIDIPIYHSMGIDDVGACVDYLVQQKRWGVSKGSIRADDFQFRGPREKLIRKIEKEELEKDLRGLVSEVWDEIEEACKVKRKRRYE